MIEISKVFIFQFLYYKNRQHQFSVFLSVYVTKGRVVSDSVQSVYSVRLYIILIVIITKAILT
jgi:hypothetical protein